MTYSDQEWVEKLESQIRDTLIFEQFDFLQSSNNFNSADETGDWGESNNSADQWGEPDPMEHDFSVEEMLDMDHLSDMPNLSQRTGEVQSDLTSRGSESGRTETFGTGTTDNSVIVNSSITDRDDIELIDIDSLFEDEADDKPVLSQDEAWELFS